mmetsp:Transcript_24585/g.69876  ORF Transcript_24585/g.69876 Transcript_24585/m.69876 type:complete len:353 (-) Transcript_24585:157-1215(-)
MQMAGDGSGGCCLEGVRALLFGARPDTCTQDQVRGAVLKELKTLQDSLDNELRGALSRINNHSVASAEPDPSEPFQVGKARRPVTVDDTAVTGSPRPRRLDTRRRHTAAADGKESLAEILKHAMLLAASSAEETAENSSVGECADQELELEQRRLKRTDSGKKDLRARIEERLNEVHQHQARSSSSDEDPDELADVASVVSTPSCSSTNWRVDALDFGDRLAATTAARKGSASVESIVHLVQSERERWEQEKHGLEARLEDLKEQVAIVAPAHDTEHEGLKRQLARLRQAVKERSRFGAWVCERHMQESDDEDEQGSSRNADKEALRIQMQGLEADLRSARREASKRRHSGS